MKYNRRLLADGLVIASIASFGVFSSVNRHERRKQGHYRLNADSQILIKFSGPRDGGGDTFRFTLTSDDKEVLRDGDRSGKMFLILVCGEQEIAVLSLNDLRKIVDISAGSGQGWVKVEVEQGCSLQVTGSTAVLPRKLPRAEFPRVLFD
jgi:hypothetical protein